MTVNYTHMRKPTMTFYQIGNFKDIIIQSSTGVKTKSLFDCQNTWVLERK